MPANPSVPSSSASAQPASHLNLAGRQRMLSQRLLLQTMLASQASDQAANPHLATAQATRTEFERSQQALAQCWQHYPAPASQTLRTLYTEVQGISPVVQDFCQRIDQCHQAIAQRRDSVALVHAAVSCADAVLQALNRATEVFDQINRQAEKALFQELQHIVGRVQEIAREAKIVSFNAQVIAARAGTEGREFSVVANVLAGISGQVTELSQQALQLVGNKNARN
ncbi:type IV pili methyl-accepting chemotaxis transducer N-terminal domain-containing protein [Curvibacter sp. CHRR-16]|uniref:type IV pili methyl-accepting chemotaxis transducer N-terminal domain-containing protein n=1 Tax=Curvibacter sp. CHRR-16 TaxID=2835872 RepID=UPI001BD952BF|nr:type IV pili methyl-accepting chemotaxis transducer N-terminal domain-containing protein [Curvibacter sp. CHRR-16]MBT0570807.1 type IV pili methyl-accepting chemotaxis transducer N-terminal domain-containing protein [Curvibacter sp. CHRR-16]